MPYTCVGREPDGNITITVRMKSKSKLGNLSVGAIAFDDLGSALQPFFGQNASFIEPQAAASIIKRSHTGRKLFL